MIGAIIGDIVGSVYEFTDEKIDKSSQTELFLPSSTFTDDTVLTVASAASIIQNVSYEDNFVLFFNMVTKAKTKNGFRHGCGFGENFAIWALTPSALRAPYNSCGNGSAMRVSPVGWAFDNAYDVLVEAQLNASPTHDHIEGIKGAQATALAILMGRMNAPKDEIKSMLVDLFDYNFDFSLDDLHRNYTYQPTCQLTVPQAIFCFLEAKSFEETLRNCLYIGGDTDTVCAIAGSVAEAKYGVPPDMRNKALELLDRDGPVLRGYIIDFEQRYGNKLSKIDTSFAQKFINLFKKKPF